MKKTIFALLLALTGVASAEPFSKEQLKAERMELKAKRHELRKMAKEHRRHMREFRKAHHHDHR
jgi:hypothetical protein